MTSRIRLALVAAVAALIATSCAAADNAATVNGVAITDEDVLSVRTAEVGDRLAGEQFRGDLTTLIVLEAELQAAEEDFGITGLDSEAARAEWLAGAGDSERNVLAGVESNPELTEVAVDVVTTQLMLRDAVASALVRDDELLLEVWQADQAALVEVCPRHILVATEAEAQDARSRVESGEDFATVADELSLDTSSPGGALPCPSSPANYVEPFATVVATAVAGEVSDPFETDFGWHIVRRREPRVSGVVRGLRRGPGAVVARHRRGGPVGQLARRRRRASRCGRSLPGRDVVRSGRWDHPPAAVSLMPITVVGLGPAGLDHVDSRHDRARSSGGDPGDRSRTDRHPGRGAAPGARSR